MTNRKFINVVNGIISDYLNEETIDLQDLHVLEREIKSWIQVREDVESREDLENEIY